MNIQEAWAGGLFEGEGSIQWNKGNEAPFLSMGSTDKDVLERLVEAVGGRVLGPYKGQGVRTPESYKPMYQWRVTPFVEVERIMEMWRPLMGERRLARWEETRQMYVDSPKKRRTYRGPRDRAYFGKAS